MTLQQPVTVCFTRLCGPPSLLSVALAQCALQRWCSWDSRARGIWIEVKVQEEGEAKHSFVGVHLSRGGFPKPFYLYMVCLRPCLVVHLKIFHQSHQIFGHMHGILNVDKKIN